MKLSIQTKPIETRYGLEKTLEIISKAGFDGIDLNLDLYARNHETFKIGDYSSFIFDKSSSEEYAYTTPRILSFSAISMTFLLRIRDQPSPYALMFFSIIFFETFSFFW